MPSRRCDRPDPYQYRRYTDREQNPRPPNNARVSHARPTHDVLYCCALAGRARGIEKGPTESHGCRRGRLRIRLATDRSARCCRWADRCRSGAPGPSSDVYTPPRPPRRHRRRSEGGLAVPPPNSSLATPVLGSYREAHLRPILHLGSERSRLGGASGQSTSDRTRAPIPDELGRSTRRAAWLGGSYSIYTLYMGTCCESASRTWWRRPP